MSRKLKKNKSKKIKLDNNKDILLIKRIVKFHYNYYKIIYINNYFKNINIEDNELDDFLKDWIIL